MKFLALALLSFFACRLAHAEEITQKRATEFLSDKCVFAAARLWPNLQYDPSRGHAGTLYTNPTSGDGPKVLCIWDAVIAEGTINESVGCAAVSLNLETSESPLLLPSQSWGYVYQGYDEIYPGSILVKERCTKKSVERLLFYLFLEEPHKKVAKNSALSIVFEDPTWHWADGHGLWSYFLGTTRHIDSPGGIQAAVLVNKFKVEIPPTDDVLLAEVKNDEANPSTHSSSATVRNSLAEYFPLKVGMWWTYSCKVASQKKGVTAQGTVTSRVSRVKKIGHEIEATISASGSGTDLMKDLVAPRKLTIKDDGIYWSDLLELKDPAETAAQWTGEAAGEHVTANSYNQEYFSPVDDKKLPAFVRGKVSSAIAISFSSEIPALGVSGRTIRIYGRNVGLFSMTMTLTNPNDSTTYLCDLTGRGVRRSQTKKTGTK